MSETTVDDCTRECLPIEVDTSLPGSRVTATLNRQTELRGLPLSITVGHGPEFESRVLDAWAHTHGARLAFIRPGEPVESACIKCFNGRLRDEGLNEHWFINVTHARTVIEQPRVDYNTERPHGALGYLTPAQYAQTEAPSPFRAK